MCTSCKSHKAIAKGLCQSCYNKARWVQATPEQLSKRLQSVKANIEQHKNGTFVRSKLLNPTPEESRLRRNTQVADRRRRLKDRLDEIKMTSGCVDCGYKEHPAALDFDHVTDVKNFNISRAATRMSWLRIIEEIKICEVRCANCHRIITAKRKQYIHGTHPRIKSQVS